MPGCACSDRNLIGDNPTVEFTFTAKVTGLPADPSALTVYLVFPDGTTVETYDIPDPEVSSTVTGTWTFLRATAPDQIGIYWVYAVATGGGIDKAVQVSFTLNDVHVPIP